MKNKLFLATVIILANVITRGPDLYHFLNTQPSQWFTGQASWFDHTDVNTFIGAICQGQEGHLLFDNTYDTKSHPRVPIYPFYTLLGFLTAPTNLSPTLVFHLAGIATSTLLSITLYWATGFFLAKSWERALALLILVFGGGLGWLFYPHLMLPDLAMPGFTLVSALRSPHESVSSSLFYFLCTWMWLYLSGKRSSTTPLFILSFFQFVFHPHMVIPLFAIPGTLLITKKFPAPKLRDIMKSLCVAFAIYFVLIGRTLLTTPSVAGIANQWSSIAPLHHLILSWGLLFPALLWAIFRTPDNLYLKAWFLSQWLIITLPISYHGMMIRGLWFPAVMLAVIGLNAALPKPRLISLIFLLLTLPSLIFMTAKRLSGTHVPRSIYLTAGEGQLLAALNTVGQPNDGVLASFRLANLIATHTNKRVWAGHNPATPEFNKRISLVNAFYAQQLTEDDAKTLLTTAHLKYVFYGPEEKAFNNGIFPYPRLVATTSATPTTTLYEVKP